MHITEGRLNARTNAVVAFLGVGASKQIE